MNRPEINVVKQELSSACTMLHNCAQAVYEHALMEDMHIDNVKVGVISGRISAAEDAAAEALRWMDNLKPDEF